MNVVDSLMERIENVKKTGFADEIIIEDHVGQKVEDIQKYNVDVFAVGSDWKGKFEYLRKYCDVVYLERTKGISSTKIRQKKYKIVKLGLIGTGRIASRFVPEVKYVSGVNLEGVYNPNITSAANFAKEFELEFWTNKIDEFLEKVDAVYIASPHETHYEYIMKALSANKHVLCEKPLVLKASQAKEAYDLAKENGLVLLEAIKTAYSPGFSRLLAIARSGVIGEIKDVEACFTKLVSGNVRELDPQRYGGSVTELASYPLLAIIKILGCDYQSLSFDSFRNQNNVDIYTKINLKYDDAIATAKVGLGVKSEGNLLISGTEGYIIVEAPWWKTKNFEVRYEDYERNEKFSSRFQNEGLRYELSDFISLVNGNDKKGYKPNATESTTIVGIIEKFLNESGTFDLEIAGGYSTNVVKN